MLKIRKGTVESIVAAARNVYPDEFLALIGDKDGDGVIDELVVLPATFGRDFSSLRVDLVPFDNSIKGSVHSHPSRNNNPSRGDLSVFAAMGKIHLIIGFPFNYNTIKAFDVKGRELEIEIIK